MAGLENKTILLTRSPEANETLAGIFASRGAKGISLPTIMITDPESWDACDEAILRLQDYRGVLFTSGNAVRQLIRRIRSVHPGRLSLLSRVSLFAVGEATEEAILEAGLTVADMPETASAEALGRMLESAGLQGGKFLFPKSEIARDTLPTILRGSGADVDEVVVYRNVPPSPDQLEEVRTLVSNHGIDLITAFSPSAVRMLVQLLGSVAMGTIPFAVIGPVTAEAARALGLNVQIVSPAATSESLVDAVESYFLNH
jgi:uroporphyrinogen-III synthase